MSDDDSSEQSLPYVPWSRVAFAYAVGLSLLEGACIAISPPLFRAVVVADAAIGWTVVLACWQGLRAVPFPPPTRAMLIASLASGHWLAAAIGAAGAAGLLSDQ